MSDNPRPVWFRVNDADANVIIMAMNALVKIEELANQNGNSLRDEAAVFPFLREIKRTRSTLLRQWNRQAR